MRGAAPADAESGHARFTLGDFTLAGACGTALSGTPTAPYSSLVQAAANHVENRTCFADVAWSHRAGDRVTWFLRAAWDDFLMRATFAYLPPPAGYGLTRDLGRDQWATAEARVSWRPWAGKLVLAGASAESHRTLQGTSADMLPTLRQDADTGVGVGDIRRDFSAVRAFLLAERELDDGLRLDGGFTWQHHEMYERKRGQPAPSILKTSPGPPA